MSCEHRRGVDPDVFLSNPRSPELREFRAHYGECDECGDVVAEWTALLTAIELSQEGGDAHLEAAQIVAYADAPNEMDELEKERVAGHLAGCRSCADEFETLRSFPFEALAPANAQERAGPLDRLRGLARGIGGSFVDAITGGVPAERDLLSATGDRGLVFQGDDQDLDEAQRQVGVLAVIEGAYQGSAYPLPYGATSLGRHPSCEIQIQDAALERIEFRIVASSDGVELVSEHPADPPFVNGVPTISSVLADGDEIVIGDHHMKFRDVNGRN